MVPPDIKFFTHSQLELAASLFLDQYNKPAGSIPIEIDLIIEKELDIRIMPFTGLLEFHGLEAYLALGCRSIYVDNNLMDLDRLERRYRFTLAEEASHLILHRDLFKDVKTVDEYLAASEELSIEARKRLQRDARRLAGAILMPSDSFERKAREQAAGSQYAGSLLRDFIVIPYLSNVFNVSEGTTSIRYEQLGLIRAIG